MVNSEFITDSEFNNYINDSWKKLYDLITEAVEDYHLISTAFTISSGNTYTLPSDFYKLRGVDDLSSGKPTTVRKFNFNERNIYADVDLSYSTTEYSDVFYRVIASTLYILPEDRATRNYKLWYYPKATTMSVDGDTIDVINGWDDFITVDVAIKALTKEESDTTALTGEKREIIERITRLKTRDEGLPEKVSRVRNRRNSLGHVLYDDTYL